MLNSATKEIFNMVKRAEHKKSALQQRLKSYEDKKEKDKRQLRMDEMHAVSSDSSTGMSGNSHLSDIYEDKKIIMDDDHEIAEIKREIAKVDGKISEINHWTAQSEFDDEEKRREAVSNARDVLQSI